MNSRRPRSVADYPSVASGRKLILLVSAMVLAMATAMALSELPNLCEPTAGMRITITVFLAQTLIRERRRDAINKNDC
jgi:hypothetical protein